MHHMLYFSNILKNWYSPRCHLCSNTLVYNKEHLFSQEQDQFAIKSSNLSFDQINLIVRAFMLGDSTIIYICNTQYLNIICIISYFNTYPFFQHYFHYNIYTIILISLHRTAGPLCCLFFDIYNTCVVLTTDKPRPFMVVI